MGLQSPMVQSMVSPMVANLKTGLPFPLLFMPLVDDLSLSRGVGSATFTRSTIKRYLRKDTGLITIAAIDEAAFEQNGILIEGASTNPILRSEEFDNAAWVKLSSASVTADQAVAPDGATTADLIDLSATDARIVSATEPTPAANVDGTFSLWLRSVSGTGTWPLAVRDRGGTFTFTLVNLTTTFQRFDVPVAGVASPSVTVLCYIGNSSGAGGAATLDTAYAWGAQFEELPFASSYIKTVASTVTRTADNLSIDAANIPAPTADYSVSASVDLLGSLSTTQRVYNVTGETNRVFSGQHSGGGDARVFNGSNNIISAPEISDQEKVVVTVDSLGGSTGFKLYRDGVFIGSNTFTAATGTKTAIDIGRRGAAEYLFGHIKNFRTDIIALTDAQQGALP